MKTTSLLFSLTPAIRLLTSWPPVMLLVLSVAAISGSSGGAAQAPAKKHAVVPRAKAIEIFKANCQLCHGPDGTGSAVMPNLNFAGRGTWKHGSTQAEVIKTISNGVPDTPMQPFKDKFTPEEIAALASLVRSYDKTPKKKL